MNDQAFLNWVADRFVNVHGESENVDFVQKLRAIAESLDPQRDTNWMPLRTSKDLFRESRDSINKHLEEA